MSYVNTNSLRVVLCTSILLLTAITVNAQFNAGVQGSVKDATGALVPEATVTLTNRGTNQSRQVTASGEGFYRFSALPPGDYTLAAEKSGFETTTMNIIVRAESIQGFDIVLNLAGVAEIVTVTDSAEQLLQTENANVDNVITTQEVLRLPQFGRDPYELARLTPGVFGQGARTAAGGSAALPNTSGPGGSSTSIFQTENQVPISANGQRLSNNNFEIDGVGVNSLGWGGAALVTPNQESVKEVRVVSAAYSAEYGRNSGAQIQVVSQSGQNEYHGSVFYKYNNPPLNSFNKWGGPTSNPNVDQPPRRVENRFRQFGGSIGGPIYLPRFGEGGPAYWSGRNRLFFFFSTEALRENNNNTSSVWVETPQYRQLVTSIRPGGLTAQVLSRPDIQPRIVSPLSSSCTIFAAADRDARCREVQGGLDIGSPTGMLGQYIASPVGGGFDGIPDIMNVLVAVPNTTRGNQYNGRIDYTVGKNTFTVSTYLTRRNDTSSRSGAGSRPSSDLIFKPKNSSGTATFIRIFSPTVINEARFNATRWVSNQVDDSSETDFGLPQIRVERIPNINQITFGANRASTTPAIFAQNQYEFRDTLTWVRGNQAWKVGAEVRREQNNSNLIGNARPDFSFDGMWNLANDMPLFEAIAVDPRTGEPSSLQRYFRSNVYGFFFQNDWKVRPNLTLNLGVRYEYFAPLTEKRNQLTNLTLGTSGLTNSRVEVVDHLYKPDRNNFAPRLGFAWTPVRFDNKLVFRGGFGIAYNRIPAVLLQNTRLNPPFYANLGLCCASPDDPTFGGRIKYVLGTSKSVLSFPVNPALVRGIDSATNGFSGLQTEVWGTTPDLPNSYVYLYSLDAQYDLPFKLIGTLGYQGSAGHKLIRIAQYHHLFPSLNTAESLFNPVFIITPDVNSNYNALNARIQRRFSQGLQFDAIYRWSKSIDALSYEGPAFQTNQTFPFDQHTERGPSDFDTRHYFTLSTLYEIQFFRDRGGLARTLLDGWQVNSIVTANTGFPFTPVTNTPSLISPGGRRLSPIRPIGYLGGNLNDTSDEAFRRPGGNFPGGGAQYFIISGTPGIPAIGRNSFRGPKYFNIDMSLVKRTYLPFIKEGSFVDLRANFFNAFNMLNLQSINFGSAGAVIENPMFGRSPGGLAGRVIELQARFSF